MKVAQLSNWFRLFRALRSPHTPVWVKALPVLALVYWLSPVDLVPDPILLVGWLDDVLVVLGLISQAMRGLPREPAALPETTR